jgi:hypothetical protein
MVQSAKPGPAKSQVRHSVNRLQKQDAHSGQCFESKDHLQGWEVTPPHFPQNPKEHF